MCLDRLEKFRTNGVGWKVLRSDRTHIYQTGKALPVGEWKVDTKVRKIGGTVLSPRFNYVRFSYGPGFHIYTRRADAEQFMHRVPLREGQLWKCRFRKVVATGYQTGQRVIVAKEIMLIEEVKG